jgi:hypothetical protein
MDIFHDVKLKKSDLYVFARTVYVVIRLYSPARCRQYVGEIYELEYYYHPPILFLSYFSFSFSFSFFFFYFSLYSIPTTIDGAYLSFYQNIL